MARGGPARGDGRVIFRQILHPATGCASYVFGCTGRHRLAVVDPHDEHVKDYLGVAEAAGSPIVAIIETHVQADHESGAGELSRRSGAEIMLHAAAGVDFPHGALRDGAEIELGNDYIRVLHTPGHSPDSICLLVGDRTRGEEPWFILTGDTLFVGDAGRPDLERDGGVASAAAGQLHDSLQRLLTLPDELEVYPGHFAGSTCGRAMSAKPSSTIGYERRHNPALAIPDQADFVAFMLDDLPPAPAEHERMRAANRAG